MEVERFTLYIRNIDYNIIKLYIIYRYFYSPKTGLNGLSTVNKLEKGL
jgi:hypothetical protein